MVINLYIILPHLTVPSPPPLSAIQCRANGPGFVCNRLHFRVIVFQWTDPSLGNCSYLDTCRHMNKCKFIHYELDDSSAKALEGTPGQPDKPTVPAYLQVQTAAKISTHTSLSSVTTGPCSANYT